MSYINQIYKQNPWFDNIKNIEQDPHIKMLAQEKYLWREQQFLDHKFKDGVYVLTGMRQIGKSTHLKLFIKENLNNKNNKNLFYFNFDFLDSKKEIIELLEEYLEKVADKNKRVFLLLDEITSIKNSILAIKYLVDAGFKKNITYILSGSSSVNFKKTGEYLPGRRGKGVDFVFSPLGFKDYLLLTNKAKTENVLNAFDKKSSLEIFYEKVKTEINLKREFDKYLICGGKQKIINTYLVKREISIELFNSYLLWIKSETAKNDRQERYDKIILSRIMQSLSSDLSYNSIAQDTGVGSHNTVYDYLGFLEDTFVTHQLYNFDFSQNKINWRKNKKIYFQDIFIYWLIDLWINTKPVQDFIGLKDDVLKSRLVENAVANNLFKIYKDELFFHQSTYEIDFMTNNRAWEVKYQNRISNMEINNILKFKGKRFVLSKNDLKISKDLVILPVEYFLLLSDLL